MRDCDLPSFSPFCVGTSNDRSARRGYELLVSCPINTNAVTVSDTPGIEQLPGGQAHLIARFPRGHPVRRGDRVELAVDVSQLSLFDPHTGQALWNPAA